MTTNTTNVRSPEEVAHEIDEADAELLRINVHATIGLRAACVVAKALYVLARAILAAAFEARSRNPS
jgi:hypothetical protein